MDGDHSDLGSARAIKSLWLGEDVGYSSEAASSHLVQAPRNSPGGQTRVGLPARRVKGW